MSIKRAVGFAHAEKMLTRAVHDHRFTANID
jgi:hypothetical protein